uniref:Uncharacterized protein n=1 Tax=Anguilla anguilla TaxID=7936 RepID=A0A0E9WAW1_ANGAN
MTVSHHTLLPLLANRVPAGYLWRCTCLPLTHVCGRLTFQ